MSRQRLAIVGPTDSVKLIYTAAQLQRYTLVPIPMVYNNAADVPELLRQQQEQADIWLFSGVVPYRYALTVPRWNKPLLYIPHTGSSLYRAFLKITQALGLPLAKLSFDTYSRYEIEEAFSDLALTMPKVYLKPYDGVIAAEELTAFHQDLWEKRLINVAVTCFHKTVVQLQAQGIPAIRISPTPNNIRTALESAARLAVSMRYSEAQIATVQISIERYDQLVHDAASSYDVNRLEIRLHELLIDFAQQVGGALIPQGRGKYIIFTTRGQIASITGQFKTLPLLTTIHKQLKLQISGGIGFGSTAYQAEENAHTAHGLAARLGAGQWIIVTDDRQVLGPLNSAEQVYAVTPDTEQQRNLARSLQISIVTLNRLTKLVADLNGHAISINTLAEQLNITPRSTRRIITALKTAGFVYASGEATDGIGRPRKLYRFCSTDLLANNTSEI